MPFVQHPGSRAVMEPELLVIPHRLDELRLGLGQAHTSTASSGFPVAEAVDLELGEGLIDGADEFVHLFEGVAGSDGDAETFFANGDRGVVDGLNVDVVIGEKLVRCCLGECGISNEDGDDMGRTGADERKQQDE